MTPPSTILVLTLIVLTAILGAGTGSAQDGVQSNLPEAGFGAAASPAPQQPGVESNLPEAGFVPSSDAAVIHVYSRETVIDVLVTDDKGKPVTGLKRSDFKVLEDGHPQPIRSFSETSASEPLPAPPILPRNTFTNATTLPSRGPIQVFLFDILTTDSANMVRTKHYVADYFRTMPAGTQVALFALSPSKGLVLMQGFTTDGERCAAAVDRLDPEWLRNPAKASADPIAAAENIAAYVAGVHGRKNLIWVGSPPMITRDGGLSASTVVRPGSLDPPDMKYVHSLMDVYDRFTREEIAVYPFNPNGVIAPGANGPPRALGRGTLNAEQVADATGGAAIYNTNDFKGAVAKVVNDTSHYYTVSYVPPRVHEDAHFHSIKIEVNRPGLHPKYRGGYNDEEPRPPDDILKVHMTQASMGLGSLPSTQLLFNLQAQPTQPDQPPDGLPKRTSTGRHVLASANRRVSYDVLFTFDSAQLPLLENADRMRTNSLEFDIAAYDNYGQLASVRSQTLKLALTPEEYTEFIQTPFKFYMSIELPPGQLTLRTGVFDSVGGNVGTLEIPVTVPKPAIRAAER